MQKGSPIPMGCLFVISCQTSLHIVGCVAVEAVVFVGQMLCWR